MRLAQYAMQEPCDGPPTFPMRIGINSARRLINFQAQYELRPSPSHPHSWVALQLDASEWEVEEAAGTPPDQLKGFMVRRLGASAAHLSGGQESWSAGRPVDRLHQWHGAQPAGEPDRRTGRGAVVFRAETLAWALNRGEGDLATHQVQKGGVGGGQGASRGARGTRGGHGGPKFVQVQTVPGFRLATLGLYGVGGAGRECVRQCVGWGGVGRRVKGAHDSKEDRGEGVGLMIAGTRGLLVQGGGFRQGIALV